MNGCGALTPCLELMCAEVPDSYIYSPRMSALQEVDVLMSFQTFTWAFTFPKLKPRERIILLWLSEASSGLDPFSTASPQWISDRAWIPLPQVEKSLRLLQKLKIIENVSDDPEVAEYFGNYGSKSEFYWKFSNFEPSINQFARRKK